MKQLSITLFGDLQVIQGDTPLTGFHYNKVRALLALLVIEPERAYRREELIGLLWPDQPETAARTNLRQALATLRDCLGEAQSDPPCLLASRESIQWNAQAAVAIDVQRFTSLLAECERHSHRQPKDCRPCAERRAEALKLFRGDLLRGFFLPDSEAFDEWLVVRRESLHRQAVDAFHELAEYHERRGEYDLAEALVRRDLELEPWDEASHRRLMRLLYLSERRSQALAQYELCRKALADELGVEPEEATTVLYEQIRSEAAAAPVPRAVLALPAAHPHNLPPTVTPFIGREQELAQIADTFERGRSRIISLVGPGGIGKTRLALQAATQQLDNFQDGVFFILLEGLTKSEEAVYAIARMLDLEITGDTEALPQLISLLSGKELLLVLDSYEHLLPDLTLPLKITGGTPRVSILVTSRQRLNLLGEQVIDVNGLSLAGHNGHEKKGEPDALELFAACASRVRADFVLESINRPYADQICKMLDGIPLAIEMAAAWLNVLTCQELVEEIHRDINIISGTLQGVPERQTSLRGIFDYAWELLSAEEAQLFRRLAVFHGGFSRQAAEEIAGANLLLLKSLVDKTLIRRNFRQGYDMHELAHQYAFERLVEAGEADDLRWRHLDYYVEYMDAVAPRLYTQETAALLVQLEDDQDNLRAALDWALVQRDLLACLRLVVAANRFWLMRYHAIEADRYMQTVMVAVRASGESFPLQLLARAYHRAGLLAYTVRDFERVRPLMEEAICLARQAGDLEELANAQFSLGAAFYNHCDFENAQHLLEEVLAYRRTQGKRDYMGSALVVLGMIAQTRRDFATAQVYIDESLAIQRALGNVQGECMGVICIAWQHLLQQDLPSALRTFQQALGLAQQIQSLTYTANCLNGIAMVSLASEGKAETGARLFGAAGVIFELAGVVLMEGPDGIEDTPFLEQGRRALGDAAWEAAVEAGCRMGQEEAIRLAEAQ
jgi:predicted ATPase/DNA-binding SARP family transcriptional activator